LIPALLYLLKARRKDSYQHWWWWKALVHLLLRTSALKLVRPWKITWGF